MLKAKSGHIHLKTGKYQDLLELFPEIYETFLNVTGQDIEENEEVNAMILQVNLRDLKNNKKPEGFNRQRATRLIFPISNKVEFYFYGDAKTPNVSKATDATSQILTNAGLEHTITWDEMFTDELKRRKALLSGK